MVALGRLAAGVHARLTAGGLRTLAITGSSGKTSTKDLLGQVLAAAGPTVSPPGSYNNDIGLPLTVLDADETTRYLVLEMGSRGPGHIARLCGVARPQVGVVLNVGSAHLGRVRQPRGHRPGQGRAGRGAAGGRHRRPQRRRPARARHGRRAPRARVLTTGLGEDADVRATGVSLDGSARARFTLVAAGEEHPVALQVVGAAPGGQRAVGRRRGAGRRARARRRSPPRCPRPGRAAAGGWRWSAAPTG